MRKKRGFTLPEVLVGSTLMSLLILYSLSLLTNTLRTMQKTDSRVEMSDKSANVLRKISEDLRAAFSVTVSSDGRTLTFTQPKLATTNDSVTGEKEFLTPIQSDGIIRNYTVNSSGQLRYWEGTGSQKTILTGILLKDPDPQSSKYNQDYNNFQFTKVGNRVAIQITLLTERNSFAGKQSNRMTALTFLRNAK